MWLIGRDSDGTFLDTGVTKTYIKYDTPEQFSVFIQNQYGNSESKPTDILFDMTHLGSGLFDRLSRAGLPIRWEYEGAEVNTINSSVLARVNIGR